MAHEIVEQHKDTLYQHAIRLLIPSHQTELSRTDSRQVGSASLLFMLMPHEHSYHSRVVVTRSTATAAAVVCHKECASAVCHRTIKILAVTESVLLLSLFVIKNVLLPLRVIRSSQPQICSSRTLHLEYAEARQLREDPQEAAFERGHDAAHELAVDEQLCGSLSGRYCCYSAGLFLETRWYHQATAADAQLAVVQDTDAAAAAETEVVTSQLQFNTTFLMQRQALSALDRASCSGLWQQAVNTALCSERLFCRVRDPKYPAAGAHSSQQQTECI